MWAIMMWWYQLAKKKKNLYVYSGNMIESSKELNMSPISILAEKHA